MKKILRILLVLLLLCACGSDPASPPTQSATLAATTPAETMPATVPVSPTETIPAPPVTIYEGAVEDLMLPLEEHSTPRLYDPEFVVIHFTSAVVNHRDDPYNMDLIRDIFLEYKVSIHYIIQRDGTVRCYVPEDRVARHASKGSWNDDPKYDNTMNEYAIGIELVAIGSERDMSIYLSGEEYRTLDSSLPGFTDAQYAALRDLVADICARNAIPMDRQHIIGHEEYAPHKNDPGELFDWSRVISE